MTLSKSLEGQIAIVTGASRGIGKAIAIFLAKEDMFCFIIITRTEVFLKKSFPNFTPWFAAEKFVVCFSDNDS